MKTPVPHRLLLGAGLAWLAACAPPEPAAPPAPPPVETAAVAEERITAEAALAHVSFLAADQMRGRDTPSPELERAADYLAGQFEGFGLEPAGDEGSFLQRWPFERIVLVPEASEAGARIGDAEVRWTYPFDYFSIPGSEARVEGAPTYAGSPAALMDGLPDGAAGRPLVVSLPDGLGPDFGFVIQSGMQAGVSGIVLLMDEETDASATFQIAGALEAGAAGEIPVPVIGLAYEAGQAFLESADVAPRGARDPPEVLEDVEIAFRSSFAPRVDEVPNVVAKLPGSDPELSESYVVLTAHFDHVGIGPPDERGDSIYSGADDNASGTSALLQAAEAFAALPEPPARSILFLAVSGEEKGLLGSAHFARNPTVPQEGLVANVNMDMVGRNAPDTVHAIGMEFTTLGRLVLEVGEAHPELGLVVAPDPEPEEQAFLRSDHFSFVEQGIPALMLTTWLHDDYHLPSDTVDRIDADKVARVARLGFLLSHAIASDREPPEWTEEGRALLEELGIR